MNKNFIDLEMISSILPRFGKRDFRSLLDQKLAISYDELSPSEMAFFAEKITKEWDFDSEIDDKSLNHIFDLENSITNILFDMEKTGVCLDIKKMQKISKNIKSEISALETQIFDIIGERININSPKQLQVLFFEKLGIKPIKKNKTWFSVDNDVLQEIAKTHDIARLILEYRSLAKLSSTYVDGLLKAVDFRDNKIHTNYDSTGTSTGRMSSNDPNLQNIPTGEGYANEIKSCFIASEWNILIVADYSQIELRILALLSQDNALIETFKNNEDIHTRTAKFLFWEKEITSNERRIAKSVNFGVIYGITGFGLAKTLECSPWEAQKYIESFYEKYPSVRTYYDNLLEKWRENGFVETFFGRKRYIPTLNDSNKTIRSIAEREAMNMPIQWTAADILKLAMIEIFSQIQSKNLKWKMILQVHDELVFDVPENEKNIFIEIIQSSMEKIFELQKIQKIPENIQIVPLIVDIWFWKNWSEAK